jgi:hypothetical protein
MVENSKEIYFMQESLQFSLLFFFFISESCPGGFSLLHHNCLQIVKENQTLQDAENTCKNLGGRIAWFSDWRKESVIQAYLEGMKT